MYKTRLNLIEPTKLLERVTVDNLRFLNPIGHDYLSGAYLLRPEINIKNTLTFATYLGGEGGQSSNTPSNNLKDKLYGNVSGKSIPIYEVCWWSDLPTPPQKPYPATITVTDPTNNVIYTRISQKTTGDIIDKIDVNNIGDYKITYENQNASGIFTATYNITVLNNISARKPYTITDVINRILNAGVGAWNGYYKLDPKFAEKWSKIEAPEFEITGKTLFEALLMVGGYKDIQAIPRLGPTPGSEATGEDWKYNFITFDELNGNSEWIPPAPYLARQVIWNGESYCGALESYVDNFVDNSAGGATRFPFPKTVRSENSDLIIDDNYAIIKTKYPIYKVNKVTQARINGSGGEVGEITPYVFEKGEYDNLSKYTGDFPNAKQYAFFYIQGQPNLYGLVLKKETMTSLDVAMAQFAAVQIAEKRSGQKYDVNNGIAAFAYTVDYTPMTSRRIRQIRPTSGYPNGNTLYYNQSANIVDSKNYGGRMKGELARIGDEVIIETYRLFKLSDMPKAGQIKDGMYISQVDWEIQLTSIKVTIYLVKNYNRLSEYVGINSMQRFYEVSEKQATNRMCNFSYIAKTGDKITDGQAILTLEGMKAFAKTFKQTQAQDSVGEEEIAFCVATAYSKDGVQIQAPTIHEVISTGFGNSMCFYFSFEDNYSAGDQALYLSSSRRIQRAVPYGDEYGEFYTLKMDFYKFKSERNKALYPNGFTYADQTGENGWCNLLPQVKAEDFESEKPYMSYTAVIDKNSGEKISIETQIHFQATDPDVIIGSALGEDSLLVSNTAHEHNFVMLPYKLRSLQESIPVEDIEKYRVANLALLNGASVSSNENRIRIPSSLNTTSQTAYSWACVNENGGILIGRNERVGQLEWGTDIVLNFNLTIK